MVAKNKYVYIFKDHILGFNRNEHDVKTIESMGENGGSEENFVQKLQTIRVKRKYTRRDPDHITPSKKNKKQTYLTRSILAGYENGVCDATPKKRGRKKNSEVLTDLMNKEKRSHLLINSSIQLKVVDNENRLGKIRPKRKYIRKKPFISKIRKQEEKKEEVEEELQKIMGFMGIDPNVISPHYFNFLHTQGMPFSSDGEMISSPNQLVPVLTASKRRGRKPKYGTDQNIPKMHPSSDVQECMSSIMTSDDSILLEIQIDTGKETEKTLPSITMPTLRRSKRISGLPLSTPTSTCFSSPLSTKPENQRLTSVFKSQKEPKSHSTHTQNKRRSDLQADAFMPSLSSSSPSMATLFDTKNFLERNKDRGKSYKQDRKHTKSPSVEDENSGLINMYLDDKWL